MEKFDLTGPSLDFASSEVISTRELPLKEISEHGKILVAKLADHILTQSGLSFQTFKDNETMIYYDFNTNEGIWRLDGKEKVKAYTLTKIQKEAPELDSQLSRFVMEEILARVKWSTYMDRSEFQTKPEHICVNNGVYDLATGQLKPHSPGFNFLSKVPVDYVPGQDCPAIDGFLEDVFGANKQLFYEVAGYCLEPGNKYQRAFMCIGFGDNGKSTALNLLKAFLGPQNVSTRSLQSLLEDRFASADLYGRLANIHADIPARTLLQTGCFKTLSGQDTITAEHKFQSSFQFENGAKLIFSCNILPESSDDTDAFMKRWILIPFSKTIPPEQQDKQLLAKLTTPTELSGLLNQAITAYRQVQERGQFTGEGSIEAKREFYTRLSDPISCFIEDCVDFNPDKYTVKQALFQAFQTYCKTKRYGKVYSQKKFFRDFRDKAGANYVIDSQIRIDNGATRVFRGVELREDVTPFTPLSGFSNLLSPELTQDNQGLVESLVKREYRNPDNHVKPVTSNDFQDPTHMRIGTEITTFPQSEAQRPQAQASAPNPKPNTVSIAREPQP